MRVIEKQRERERERERETGRESEREREWESERVGEWERERRRERQRERESEREMERGREGEREREIICVCAKHKQYMSIYNKKKRYYFDTAKTDVAVGIDTEIVTYRHTRKNYHSGKLIL